MKKTDPFLRMSFPVGASLPRVAGADHAARVELAYRRALTGARNACIIDARKDSNVERRAQFTYTGRRKGDKDTYARAVYVQHALPIAA